MSFELTARGAQAVAMLKTRYDNLLPAYGRNTFDRVAHENGHLPTALIIYALGAPGGDDRDEMVKQGFAVRSDA